MLHLPQKHTAACSLLEDSARMLGACFVAGVVRRRLCCNNHHLVCARRILRVLRVFRMKHIMRRHLEGAVMEAAGKLVFSLLSIMFIAAGLFYELERYGPPSDKKAEDLKFHQSLYWCVPCPS